MTHYTILGLLVIVTASACAPFSGRYVHDVPYELARVPSAPNYESPNNWAALPNQADEADAAPPNSAYFEAQADAAADVFWIYPTIYTDDPKGRFAWNASTTDMKLNQRIDESSIRMQASVFNAAGRVYAPRYRQAHISAYYTQDSTVAQAAFDTAYADVRRAFDVFLRKHNQGRPIIIAGHSQGTTHGKRLVRDYFDGTPLAEQLVAAYLIGIPVAPDYFTDLPVCSEPNQTSCFVSWRTWQRPATPWSNSASAKTGPAPRPYPVVVNPLSWRTNSSFVPATDNPGGTLRKLSIVKALADAQIHQGILWINRPNFFGKRIIRMENWHAADINLFYESVRANAVARVKAWQAKQ